MTANGPSVLNDNLNAQNGLSNAYILFKRIVMDSYCNSAKYTTYYWRLAGSKDVKIVWISSRGESNMPLTMRKFLKGLVEGAVQLT